MPTVRGWAALGASLALVVLWVAFGEDLLFAVAALLGVAVDIGVVYTRIRIPRVSVSRRVSPLQLHDGDRAIVNLTLTSSKRLTQAELSDNVAGLGSANFIGDIIEADDPMVARYEVLCRPRGVYRIGPALIQVRDVLGLAEAGGTAGKIDRLVVYPAVEDLHGLPLVRGQDPNLNTSKASFSHVGGEDFFTLREYQRGDDLRRVHWPSSAKRDDLMIKQLEMPWQSRALVLLDRRAGSYASAEAFEHAVRGTASVVRHLFRGGFSPTMWTGVSKGTPVTSAPGYAMAMEELATVQTDPNLDLRSQVNRMRRSGIAGGALVLVTGNPDDQDLAVYRILGRDFLRTIVMAVAEESNEAILAFGRGGAITIRSGAGSPWSPAWREAMERTWSTATAG
jgi:uncharacterized protein (DUF58 family)